MHTVCFDSWMPLPPDTASWRRTVFPAVGRATRNLERLILGVWAGLVAAAVSVFASAVPNIYTSDER